MKEKKTNCGIYLIINLIPHEITGNLKVYAGSSENLKSRKYKHFWYLKNNKHHCDHLQRAYNKIKEMYGEENVNNYFEFKPLIYLEKIKDKTKLKEVLLEHENLELSKYKKEDGTINHDKCYNIQSKAGSNLGITLSEEHKNKISKSSKGHSVTDETKNKLSEAHKGKKLTEETKRKMSKSHTGIKQSKETKEKISMSNMGKTGRIKSKEEIEKMLKSRKWYKHTKETKEKMSTSRKNYKTTEETKNKISNSNPNKRCVINLDTDKIFISISEASRFYNLDKYNISKACSGSRKTVGGYRWAYLTC